MSSQITELHPYVQEKAGKFLDMAQQEGIDVRVTHTYRSKAEQDALYAKGRTTPGNIVTNARYPYSFHNHRVAFDVVPLKNGQPVWNDYTLWNKLGEIGKNLGLEWGGDWHNFPDYPHFQYTGGLTIYDLINGKTLPLPESTHERPSVISDWALSAWESAKEKGIVQDATRPQDPVLKEELMVFLDRAGMLDNIPLKNFPSEFNFEGVSQWAVPSWQKAVTRGIVQKNTQPQDTVTKEEVIVFFDRAGVLKA